MASGTLAAGLKPSLNWLLVFIPISVYLEHFQAQAHLWIFFASCVAIIPLAGLLGEATPSQPWSGGVALLVLGVSTFFMAWMSEILVGSVEQAAEAVGMSNIFVGIIVVAIVGNAAEHSTAVMVAVKNRMTLVLALPSAVAHRSHCLSRRC